MSLVSSIYGTDDDQEIMDTLEMLMAVRFWVLLLSLSDHLL